MGSKEFTHEPAPSRNSALPHRVQCPTQTFQTQLQPGELRHKLHNSCPAWILGSLQANVVPPQRQLRRVEIFQLSQERVVVKPLCL